MIKKNIEDEIYKDYIASCARVITENTANGCQGSFLQKNYRDIVDPKPEKIIQEGEAIKGIRAKLG